MPAQKCHFDGGVQSRRGSLMKSEVCACPDLLEQGLAERSGGPLLGVQSLGHFKSCRMKGLERPLSELP